MKARIRKYRCVIILRQVVIIPASEISHGYLLRMNSKKLKNTQHFSKSQAKAH